MKQLVRFLAFLSVTVAPLAADIANGQFLLGSTSPGSYLTLPAGSTTLTGWTVTSGTANAGGGGSVDWIGTYWAGVNGNSVDLDGNNPGGITQTVTLPLGASLLNFYLTGNQDGSANNSLTVGINGTPTTISNITPGSAWALEQIPFTSTGTTTVAFTSNDASSSPYGPVVSDVSVTQGLVNGHVLGTGSDTHPGTFVTIPGGNSTAIPGWTVTPTSVDLVGGYWTGPNGANTVDLDGNAPGGISQLVNFSAGVYRLSFWLAGNPDGPPPTKDLNLAVGGVNYQFLFPLSASNPSCTATRSNMCGTEETVTFAANGPETIAFSSLDNNSPYGPVVGAITLTQVPEAGFYAYSAFVFGIASLFLLIRRARQA